MEFEDEIFNDGLPKKYYKHNDNGQYVLEADAPWAEKVSCALIISGNRAYLEEIRKAVLAGQKSPLCYYMEMRQMDPGILAKAAGIAAFRVKRHLRPEIFAKLKPSVLNRYTKALRVTLEELKTVPNS
ncbi:MAG: hypothetical protein PHH96_05805 [Smithellaceae bacterium]|jgi:hypothetical protein|nr:hypothetical protein [Smithellaceae bacterium]MDD5414319.1 hypothetical protein [Smithellaceae bacterium]HBJ75780.1 hypothetical protein [Syntrophaceae bacterium]HCS76574.1 hypothetical protein [Syntrophaceae bacterium]HCX01385.1 hypothetical protein [Syntrophaceae bacterium]